MKAIVTLLLFATVLFSYSVPDSLRREARMINDLLINCQFSQARKIADQLIAKNPSEPLYYYLKIASVGLETLDRDEVVLRSEFTKTYDKGMAVLAAKSDLTKNSYLMMIQGFLQSSLTSYNLLDGKYGSAVSVGKAGLKSVETARKLNPANYDVDYYLGFFSYARGELKKRVPILFWLENSSKTGIAQLQKCSDHGLFMNAAADMVLVDVLVREGELNRAEKMLTTMLKEYPRSRFLLWTQTRLQTARGENRTAAETFLTLAKSYIGDKFYHNALFCTHEAIKLLTDQNDRKRAAAEIISRIPRSAVTEKDRKSYDKLTNLAKES